MAVPSWYELVPNRTNAPEMDIIFGPIWNSMVQGPSFSPVKGNRIPSQHSGISPVMKGLLGKVGPFIRCKLRNDCIFRCIRGDVPPCAAAAHHIIGRKTAATDGDRGCSITSIRGSIHAGAALPGPGNPTRDFRLLKLINAFHRVVAPRPPPVINPSCSCNAAVTQQKN